VYYPYYDADGYIGLPFCFTHNVAMTEYGDTGPCVYLGWDWLSPQFESLTPQNPNWNYAEFACYFFDLMHAGGTVTYALNGVSMAIYGTPFPACPDYNSLIVLGNQNMPLTY
jgi:hypothetical protein